MTVDEPEKIKELMAMLKDCGKEAEAMDRESLISNFVCAMGNWNITQDELKKALDKIAKLETELQSYEYQAQLEQTSVLDGWLRKCKELEDRVSALEQENATLEADLSYHGGKRSSGANKPEEVWYYAVGPYGRACGRTVTYRWASEKEAREWVTTYGSSDYYVEKETTYSYMTIRSRL